MTRFMENQQIIHIVSELVILVGLVFWFQRKTSNLMSHIDDLSQRVEEQEELIQKHEDIIKKLVEAVNGMQVHNNYGNFNRPRQQVQSKNQSPKQKKNKQTPVLPPVEDKENDVLEDDQLSDSDLDAALTEEIKELTESESEKN